ncbi:hypothetical protein SFMTTN_0136 [Sulfuriferula multivorans]|uniref:Uncharacterized protein n=1 Tax=Sulfuriferula multivorans TaxID=1559896 RepID=A0A401J9P6_9PROT|nr:hypothetical protein SFMTTN_0136 [Sulfuriferula multivorans]
MLRIIMQTPTIEAEACKICEERFLNWLMRQSGRLPARVPLIHSSLHALNSGWNQ